MGLRGPPKRFTEQTHVGLTELQKQFLELSAAAGNRSVAAVLRRLISAEILRRIQEARNGRG
jgi:hypothetical protein